MQNYCRVAPSIGKLEGDPNDVWGTLPYYQADKINDLEPTVFFGLYGLNDFYSLWRHKGKKWIFWAGSDIRHFKAGYWLDEKGEIRIRPAQLAPWIEKYCESWVENEVERLELRSLGIHAKVGQSFMGDINDYEVRYKPDARPKVYASVSSNDFELYKWKDIEHLAYKHPGIEFHLYGNTVEYVPDLPLVNFIVHGRVPKEQMNREVRDMQAAIRPLEFDGFSEVLAKSVLWGQWPIAKIDYPYMLKMGGLDVLVYQQTPNKKGRDYYIKSLNSFPWVTKK